MITSRSPPANGSATWPWPLGSDFSAVRRREQGRQLATGGVVGVQVHWQVETLAQRRQAERAISLRETR